LTGECAKRCQFIIPKVNGRAFARLIDDDPPQISLGILYRSPNPRRGIA
jgi:hypothetical protein